MKGFIPKRPTGDDAEARFMQAVWDNLFGPASKLVDTNTVKWNHTTKGHSAHAKPPKTSQSSSPIKTFKIYSEFYNYLSCREWAGNDTDTLNNPIVAVAKPYDLRLYMQTPVGNSVSDVTFTQWGHTLRMGLVPVSSNGGITFLPNARVVTFNGGGLPALAKTYYEFIDPPYMTTYTVPSPLPDGWQETQRDLITACKPSNGVGSVGGDAGEIEWLDMNVSARKWRKELQVCDGGVARYMRVDSSEVYAGTIVPI